VRDLQAEFPATAYTTLMTTLDRLFRKGVLARAKDGRAFRYSPRYTPQALLREVVRRTFARLLGRNRAAMRPVLSTLVDAVTEQDADALDELERLVRERRTLARSQEGDV
jgi:predicted transcriptional regulator